MGGGSSSCIGGREFGEGDLADVKLVENVARGSSSCLATRECGVGGLADVKLVESEARGD